MMARSPTNSIPRILHGSTTGMVPLPDSFPNPLTNCQDISVEQIEMMSVSQLLAHNVLHQGFVYKRANNKKTDRMAESMENMLPVKLGLLNRWQLRYVIIYSHFVVYYKDDKGKRPVGHFSLRDYNRVVRAEEMVSSDRKWPFKIIGMRYTARTWFFCAPSEREMKLWMACFKATMDHAIHGKVKQTCLDIITKEQRRISPEGDESSTSAGSTGSDSGRSIQDDDTYDDLEAPASNTGNMDDNYDDIDEISGDESMHSGSSGSGGRCHPQLTGVSSAANAIYEVDTLSDLETKRISYFSAEQLEDYMAVVSDDDERGKRVNSDPPRRHYRNNSPAEARNTTPKAHRRLPMSPGSRPKFPEPEIPKDNYDYPGPRREPPEPPMRPALPQLRDKELSHLRQNLERQGLQTPQLPDGGHPLRKTGIPIPQLPNGGHPLRKTGIPTPQLPTSDHPSKKPGLKRQGPDGDSFRHKSPPPEVEKKPAPLPRPPAKPNKPIITDHGKPGTLPKPAVAPKKTKDPLPKSAFLDSADKEYANELLRRHGHNGMYLVRESARDPSKKVVMVWDQMVEKAKHYTVFGDQKNSFALDQTAQFGSLLELIEYYTKNYLPNTNLKLTKPCPG